jgi:multisubunit Na+/H+ antiporter MnhC subunit
VLTRIFVVQTRIGMALPQACVGCYYVCFAENPTSRLFDPTIPERLHKMQEGADPLVPTPRFPQQHPGAA